MTLKQHVNNTTQRGFTLLELLVVMVIIGILASLVGGSFLQSQIKGRDSQRKSDLSQLKLALEAYVNDYGLYPAESSGQIVACGSTPVACEWGETMQDGNNTVYMAILPRDRNHPNRRYEYRTNADRTAFWILTSLENDQDSAFNQDLFEDEISCGGAGVFCNYGVSSSNTTIDAL